MGWLQNFRINSAIKAHTQFTRGVIETYDGTVRCLSLIQLGLFRESLKQGEIDYIDVIVNPTKFSRERCINIFQDFEPIFHKLKNSATRNYDEMIEAEMIDSKGAAMSNLIIGTSCTSVGLAMMNVGTSISPATRLDATTVWHMLLDTKSYLPAAFEAWETWEEMTDNMYQKNKEMREKHSGYFDAIDASEIEDSEFLSYDVIKENIDIILSNVEFLKHR